MGFGAPNVVVDESALIDDDLYATIKRMVGGHKDNFILEIGNPFTVGHFKRTWVKGRYQRVWVDYKQALAEGRFSEDFIEEMKDEAFFDVLYECVFPEGEIMRTDGYRRLLVDATIENAYIDTEPELPMRELGDGTKVVDDKPLLGVDVAAGGANQTVYVLRYPKANFAKVLERNNLDDLDDQADIVMKYVKQYDIEDYRTCIDDNGIGHGLGDILKNKHDLLFKRVMAGESPLKELKPTDKRRIKAQQRYVNVKAQQYWELRKWVKAGGLLLKDTSGPNSGNGFEELKVLNYKQNTAGKLQIEPKEKLREQNIPSPDTAEALMLTFVDTSTIVEEDDIDIM